MTDSPKQLEREVEAKRADVEETLDALRTKMSLGQIVDELGGHFNGGQAKEMLGNVGRQVRDNPVALGLIGAGLAWLVAGDGIKRGAKQVKEQMSSDESGYDDTGRLFDGGQSDDVPGWISGSDRDQAASGTGTPDSEQTDALSSLKSVAGDMLDEARGATSKAVDGIDDGLSSVGTSASKASDRVKREARQRGEQARHAAEKARSGAAGLGRKARNGFADALQDQPLVLGALAVAVGAAVGAALPPTRSEDRLVGPHRDALRDNATDYARERGEDAAAIAEKSYQKVKDTAQSEGLVGQGQPVDKSLAARAEAVIRDGADTVHREALKKG